MQYSVHCNVMIRKRQYVKIDCCSRNIKLQITQSSASACVNALKHPAGTPWSLDSCYIGEI